MSQIGIQPNPSSPANEAVGSRALFSCLVELSKPGIVRLTTMSTAIGFLLAALGREWNSLVELGVTFVACIVGTALSGAGANSFNMV